MFVWEGSSVDKRSKIVIFLVYFLAFLGIALPYPVFVPLFLDGYITSDFAPEVALGVALAVYPLGLFFGGGTLGSLSDKYGRRPVLLWSLFLTTLGTVWSGYAIIQEDFWQLVLSRLVTGYFEANSSIARAMLIDREKDGPKASSFAFLSVGGYAGYLFGPVLGGILAAYGTDMPFLIAGIMSGVALVLAVLWLPETNEQVIKNGVNKVSKRPGVLKMISEHRMFRKLLLAQFLLTLGINTFYQYYPLLLKIRWNSSVGEIAFINSFFTGSMIVFALFGVPRLEKIMSLGHKLIYAGITLAIFMGVILFVPDYITGILVASIIGFAVSILNAAIPAFVSRETQGLEQGAVMGSLTSSFCMAQAIISLIGGYVATFDINYTYALGALAAVIGVMQIQTIRAKAKVSIEAVEKV